MVVYISGGSSGIGLATARLFVTQGADVLVFARDAKKLAEAEAALKALAGASGARVRALSLDVADEQACVEKLGEACRTFGAPTVVVNSAGIGGAAAFENETFAKFDQRMKVNVYGVRNVVAAVLPHMKAGGGHIVNVSSMAGLIGVYGFTSYAASKFAVVGFSEALRAELKRYRINVCVYCPPDVDTPMLHAENTDKPPETKAISEGGGVMSADAAAAALIRGMESGKFLVIPNAQNKAVNLINRLFPRLRERILDRIAEKARVK
jgi:short-subunit dehydrogenase